MGKVGVGIWKQNACEDKEAFIEQIGGGNGHCFVWNRYMKLSVPTFPFYALSFR